ncbi:MAG: AIPR family protein, partial [Clostridiaceae bacterium]|nr:AIPR family protein [Clostridiaceae bacterium]
YIPSYFVATAKNKRSLRVDGYFYEDIDSTMNLFISDYDDASWTGKVITKTQATAIFKKLLNFVEECFGNRLDADESTSVADLNDELLLEKSRGGIRKLKMILLTNSVMSDRIKELPTKEVVNIPVEFQIWDVERVYKVCLSDSGKETIEIDFQELAGGLPCIEASCAETADYKSYLCIIPGEVLADIYDKYGGRLLEENVRMFLSTSSSVNKKIKKTIQDEPERFFAYNNGISVTSRSIVLENRKTGLYITHTSDFQIINGGQTTASLSNTRFTDKSSAKNLKSIYVPVKMTVLNDPDQNHANDLIRNISHSANSQNKVTDADFFSTHKFHIQMEKYSRAVFAPAVQGAQYETHWFYERVRGQYLHSQNRMSKAARNKFQASNPKPQTFNKTDLAKYRTTWVMNPDIVSKGAQTNFKVFAEYITKEWETSESSFNEHYFKDSVALKILFKHVESMVTHQSWYEKGYRANIVTYTIALFHHLILEQFNGYDLKLYHVWIKQGVPKPIEDALVPLSKIVYNAITDPNRPVENVTQWCKKPKCWESVKDSYLTLDSDLEKFLYKI